MRRLLQFGTFLFVLIAFLAPLAECLDRWDPPGLNNDTEFAVFALIFVLCLVLLVSKLISALAQSIHLIVSPHRQAPKRWISSRFDAFLEIVPPLSSPPLRI
jgi:Na+/phosphate symporter